MAFLAQLAELFMQWSNVVCVRVSGC